MKNQTPLATRCMIIFCLLLIFNGMALLIHSFYLIKLEEPIYNINYFILLLLVGGLISVCLYSYQLVFKPYMRLKKVMTMFNEGSTYDLLFHSKDTFCQEMKPMFEQIEKLLDKKSAIQMSKKQAQYLALQNQINPHFLYNTLEAIRGDALDMGVTSIAQTTEALATFFRYTITEVENLVSLENELENTENYYIIQKYRFGDKINREITIEDEYALQAQIPKLTLQPIIENAIYHGLECKRGVGTIYIHIETTQSKLLISVRDDGVGISEEVLEKINNKLDRVQGGYHNSNKSKKGGIALINVSERIKLLFGEEYGLHLYSTVNMGTDVRVTLPLILDRDDEKRDL